jgi:hypothetical protein
VVTDYGKTDVEYVTQLSNVIKPNMKSYVADGSEFDSRHSMFTQELERVHHEHYVRSPAGRAILHNHFQRRRNWLFETSGVRGQADYQNASGHHATILGNGTVAKLLGFWQVGTQGMDHQLGRHSIFGAAVVTYKGDDFAFYNNAPATFRERANEVSHYTPMEYKTVPSNGRGYSEFCGYLVGPGGIAPNVFRRARKLLGTPFGSYSHAGLMKSSIQNYLENVAKLKQIGMDVDGINIAANNISPNVYHSAIDFMMSFVSCNEELFMRSTTEYTIPDVVLRPYDGGLFVDFDFSDDPDNAQSVRADDDARREARRRLDSGSQSSAASSSMQSAQSARSDSSSVVDALEEHWSGASN